MIEDNLGDARLINEMLSETLSRQIKLEHVIRLSSGLEKIKEGGIDLVLLDLGLPDSTGLDTLLSVRSEEERIPIVVLTGLEDEELGITAVKMGAQDYLNKMQINGSLLSRSIRYAIERQKAEEENREYLIELQKNKEALEKKSLELAELNRSLNELNASKDKFFSIVAHDLRSPFTALLGISDFLNKHSDEMSYSEIKEFTLHLNQSLTGVFRLIENLLQWSRVQTGRMEFNPEVFNLNDLLDETFELYKANVNNKSINLERNVPADVNVYGDRYMIETVLRNLLSNAIKFTSPKGNVGIKVCSLQNNDKVEIKVSDNGIGIPNEDIPKLFKIDETLTTEGTLNEKGTGLGLVLCKEFVEKNGGEIWVESKIGRGSHFIFTLPKSDERIHIPK